MSAHTPYIPEQARAVIRLDSRYSWGTLLVALLVLPCWLRCARRYNVSARRNQDRMQAISVQNCIRRRIARKQCDA
jgi:hypothetical protein